MSKILAINATFVRHLLNEEQLKLIEMLYDNYHSKDDKIKAMKKALRLPDSAYMNKDVARFIHAIKVQRGISCIDNISISLVLSGESDGLNALGFPAWNALVNRLHNAIADLTRLKYASYNEKTKKVVFCSGFDSQARLAMSSALETEPDEVTLLTMLENKISGQVELARNGNYARAKPTAKGGTTKKVNGPCTASVEPYEVGYDENGEAVYFAVDDGEEE